ncbi:MAG: DUF2079 domain-containing protein, partial [Halobacteriaceae archaeon]
FYYKETTYFFAVSLIVSLSIKETVPILLVPLGIWLLYDIYKTQIFERTRWKFVASVSIIATSTIWFIVAFKIFLPVFSKGPTHGLARYSYLGSSVSEIILTLLTDPTIVIFRLFSTPIFFYAVSLVLPLAFIPLRSPKAVSVGLGVFFMNALAEFSNQHTFHTHHQLQLVIAIIFAMLITFYDSDERKLNTYKRLLSISIPVTLLLYSIWLVAVSLKKYGAL